MGLRVENNLTAPRPAIGYVYNPEPRGASDPYPAQTTALEPFCYLLGREKEAEYKGVSIGNLYVTSVDRKVEKQRDKAGK